MDITLRYEYTSVSSGFSAGWSIGSASYTITQGDLDSIAGNTNQTGIWEFSLRDGGVAAAVSNTSPVLSHNTNLSLLESAASTLITTARLQFIDSEQIDANLITYTLTSVPTKGSLIKNGVTLSLSGTKTFTQADIDSNLLRFTPTTNLNLPDSFSFTVSDGAGGTTTGTFNFSIDSVNSVPVLTAPTAISYTDTALDNSFTHATGTLQATDGDGETVRFSLSGGTAQVTSLNSVAYTLFKQGTYGKLYLNSTTGNYSYLPNQTLINATAATVTDTFTLTATDGIVATPSSQTLTVTINGTNDAPIITSNAAGISAAIAVASGQTAVTTVTATDAENSSLTYAIAGG